MIKVLKNGITFKKIKCPRCNCEFEYTDIDIFETRFKNSKPIVICPECAYNIEVKRIFGG